MDSLENNVSEISLERTMCYGPCPVYKVTFRSDGRAIFEGKGHVDKLGKYIGDIDERDFERLVKLLERLDFMSLDDNYSIPIEDNAHIITTIIHNDKTKTVDNYADAGPMEIWTVEKVIDGIIDDIYWEKYD